MEYILEHLPQTFIVIGLILLTIEVAVLGFSTFVLFFVGVGAIAAGVLMTLGAVPATVLNSLLATAIISIVVAIVSWKPLKAMQNKVEVSHVTNDMIGHEFVLSDDLTVGQTVIYRYSGIDWKVQSSQSMVIGARVKIVAIDVGLMTVEPV